MKKSVKRRSFLSFIASFGLLIGAAAAIEAQNTPFVVADFNQQKNVDNIGDSFGTWDKDPNDKTQGCRMSFVSDDALGAKNGMSVRLDYDVDSPDPAYNGFWLKLDNADVANYNSVSFYLKGDLAVGFTKKIKIEIKDKKGGTQAGFIEGITSQWKMFSIPLKADGSSKKPLSEFTIVFDDINSRPKQGAILLDQITFTNSRQN